jgi:anti-sigma factor RsiW
MDASTGQLCARARFWASLRIDGELSELEGALLDAHLARCAHCRALAVDIAETTDALRAAPLERGVPVVLALRRGPRRLVVAAGIAAVIAAGALAGGLVRGEVDTNTSSTPRAVAVVAGFETADQIRRLRRMSLLSDRPIPRDLSGEPV